MFGQTLSPRLVEKLDLITGALARPVRPAHRRHHRRDHQERRLPERRPGLDLRRQPRDLRAEFRIWRFVRTDRTSSSQATSGVASSVSRASTAAPPPMHDRTDQATLFTYFDRNLLGRTTASRSWAATRTSASRSPTPSGLQPDGDLQPRRRQTTFASEQLQRTPAGGDRLRPGEPAARLRSDHPAGVALRALLVSDLHPRRRWRAAVQRTGPGGRQDGTRRLGLQFEGVYRLNLRAHLARRAWCCSRSAGSAARRPRSSRWTPLAPRAGQPDHPRTIAAASTQTTESVYLQDEWKLTPAPDPQLRRPVRRL